MQIRTSAYLDRKARRVDSATATWSTGAFSTRGVIAAATALLFVIGALSPAPTAAAPRAWAGTLEVELDAFAPLVIRGAGVATLDVSNGSQLEAMRLAGGLQGLVTLPISDLGAGVDHLEASVVLGTGSLGVFSPIAPYPDPQLISNRLPIGGALRFCGLPVGCALGLVLPLSQANGAIAIGVGGLLTVGGAGPLRVSIQANPWTVFTATQPFDTPSGGTAVLSKTGFIHGPISYSSTAGQLDAALQLVTPLRVVSNQGLNLAGFAALTLRFVPEPAAGWGLAVGAAALALLGATRRTSRSRAARVARGRLR